MLSFLNKNSNAIFKNSSRRFKPITLLKLVLFVTAIFVWIKTPNHTTALMICRLIVSILMLLTGIETYFANKKGEKEYAIWFLLAIIFFVVAFV